MYIHISHRIRISIEIFSVIFVLYQPVLSLYLFYTCHVVNMAIEFIHYTGLNKDNSLTHLLDAISPDMENEVDLVQSSKYHDDENIKIELNVISSRLCILTLSDPWYFRQLTISKTIVSIFTISYMCTLLGVLGMFQLEFFKNWRF